MKSFFWFGHVLMALFCSGCIPARYTDTPGVRGVVIDEQTKSPMPDVRIDLGLEIGDLNTNNLHITWHTNLIASTTSRPDGFFEIPVKKKWGVDFLLAEPIGTHWYDVIMEKTNYERAVLRFNYYEVRRAGSTNFGPVLLKPKH